jgi:hypothetical protein
VIIYRKSAPLRIKRSAFPAPPYWYATAFAPYGPRRASPVAIDYIDLRATASEKMEVSVTEDPSDEIERGGWRQRSDAPLLIDAAETAETVFRRGEQVLARAHDAGLAAIHLISTRGSLPLAPPPRTTVTIAAWPLDLVALEALFSEAAEQRLRWGVAVPVMFPATTDLDALGRVADIAGKFGAQYLAALPVETDATARQALARATAEDDETYAMLFHSDLEPVHIATERHIASLAREIGAADFIVPPDFAEKSNWNAATLLTLAASRPGKHSSQLDFIVHGQHRHRRDARRSKRGRRQRVAGDWTVCIRGTGERAVALETRCRGVVERQLLPVLDLHLRADAAANVKVAFHFDETGIERRDQIVGDAVCHRLMERALVAE